MTSRLRKLALTAHVIASVGWLGALGVFWLLYPAFGFLLSPMIAAAMALSSLSLVTNALRLRYTERVDRPS